MPEGHPQPAAEKALEKAEDRVLFTIFQRQHYVLFFPSFTFLGHHDLDVQDEAVAT